MITRGTFKDWFCCKYLPLFALKSSNEALWTGLRPTRFVKKFHRNDCFFLAVGYSKSGAIKYFGFIILTRSIAKLPTDVHNPNIILEKFPQVKCIFKNWFSCLRTNVDSLNWNSRLAKISGYYQNTSLSAIPETLANFT